VVLIEEGRANELLVAPAVPPVLALEPPPPQATKVPRNRLRIETRKMVFVCTMILEWVIIEFIFISFYCNLIVFFV
jgi:hypothetical protein